MEAKCRSTLRDNFPKKELNPFIFIEYEWNP